MIDSNISLIVDT